MRLVDIDKFIDDFPIRLNRYDKKNGSEKFVLGIEAVLDSLDCTPTVDAIPIDWILKWANKNCRYCLDYDYPTEKTDGWFDINNMVKDWGKENGLS